MEKKNCIQTQGSFEKGTQNKNECWEIKIKRITNKNKYIKGWEMKYKEFIGKKKRNSLEKNTEGNITTKN